MASAEVHRPGPGQVIYLYNVCLDKKKENISSVSEQETKSEKDFRISLLL